MSDNIPIKNTLLKHPRLKYCYFAEILENDMALLLSEKNSTLLTGKKLYIEVLSRIREDGSTLDDLISQLEGKFSIFEIVTAIKVLERSGYLTESTPSLPLEVCAYWNSIDIHPDSLLKILENNPITVEFLGEVPQEVFFQAFHSIGINTNSKGVLRVIVTDDYARQELQQINQEALDLKQPWMLVKPQGVELWLGPVFLPGQTGCWDCLRQRLSNNRPMNSFFKNQKKTEVLPPIPMAYLPLTLQIASNLAALEVTKWLYFGHSEQLEGKIVTMNTFTFTSQSHVLVKRPQCTVCGEDKYKNKKHPAPITLRKKITDCITTQGGYREVPLDNTLEKYKYHISPITGVVQSLSPYYLNEGTPIYNYFSGINLAMQSKTLFWLNFHSRSTNGGKGATWSQAKAGALCEAIERYSCTYQGDEYYITGSLNQLGKDAIHPNSCMNYSEKQYRDREEANEDFHKFYQMVPLPFDESLEMHWTPVYSLTRQTFKYLPSCFCYIQYPGEDELNLFAYPDTNGCAAGNTIEEAILQGFLELVERDSVAIWWYNMLRKPAVDLTSFNDPYFLQLIEFYKSLDRSLYVLDLTTDLHIPAFAALSHCLNYQKEEIIFGFGAHVDAKIAIERALIELNQILPIANVPEADRAQGKYRTKDPNFIHWLNTAARENHPYLIPLESVSVKKAADYLQLCNPNIYDSLVFCIEAAVKQNLETLVLDMTRPDIGLPVVRVIVPGLRHFWKRLAPGRLYDIPVKMEWLEKPLKEQELNPIGLFI